MSAGERGPFDIADRVTGANMGYFVGALNFAMRRDGAISAGVWNECIAAAVEFGAREREQR